LYFAFSMRARRSDRASQPSRTGARVCGQLALRRGYRLGDPFERRFVRIDKRGAVARTGRRSSATFAEEAFHNAIFEAVKGDHGQTTAGTQRTLGRGQSLLELVELGVEVDANGLERARRWIAFLAGTETGGAADDGGELGGPFDRAGRNDGASDRPRARLFAIVAQDPGDLGLVGRIRNSAAVSPDLLMRMSSGPSAEKEKPRSAWSSCIELTPISSAIASTRPMPRSASTRSIWLKRSLTSSSRESGTSDLPASIASGSRSKPITRPAPAVSMARV